MEDDVINAMGKHRRQEETVKRGGAITMIKNKERERGHS